MRGVRFGRYILMRQLPRTAKWHSFRIERFGFEPKFYIGPYVLVKEWDLWSVT